MSVIGLGSLAPPGDEKKKHYPRLYEIAEAASASDIVLLLNMGDYQREAEVIIARNRRGPECTLQLKFLGEYGKFEDCKKSPDVGPNSEKAAKI